MELASLQKQRALKTSQKRIFSCIFLFAAPKVNCITLDSCKVEWTPIRPMGTDQIVYCLQLQNSHSAEPEYRTVSYMCHLLEFYLFLILIKKIMSKVFIE